MEREMCCGEINAADLHRRFAVVDQRIPRSRIQAGAVSLGFYIIPPLGIQPYWG